VLEQEFNRIYAAYSRPLYNYALWMTGNRLASDDVLQNLFVKVWQGGSLPPDEAACRAWLYTVCRNACLDHFRAQSRGARLRSAYAAERPSSTPADAGEKLIWRQLADLEEEERSVIYLHIRIGWTYADIAQLLKLTENNVRVKAFRALRKLRKAYAEGQ
jgi:RNA polymerase sigma-70 factor (ECF subfamily)